MIRIYVCPCVLDVFFVCVFFFIHSAGKFANSYCEISLWFTSNIYFIHAEIELFSLVFFLYAIEEKKTNKQSRLIGFCHF